MKVKIQYTINDGYVGNRPQYFTVDKEEWDEMNDGEKEQYVDEVIKGTLSYDWKAE